MRISAIFSRFFKTLTKRPATSFIVLVILLFGSIALGHVFRTPPLTETTPAPEVKKTTVFRTSDTAFVSAPAKVKKESIVHIVALAPGVVTSLFTSPGRTVVSGQTLLTLSNDYGSGGATLQKGLATETARLTAELAKIDKNITALEEKQTKRNDSLSKTAEDIALAKLKKDRATRKSTLAQSALTVNIANVSDAVLKPKVFATGTVESIRVRRGDFVTPGQVLATVATQGATILETFLDAETMRHFDPTKEAKLHVGTETFSLLPTSFAKHENENGLFPILFTLSDSLTQRITNGEYLQVSLPLRNAQALLPIDALFQDEQGASVLVVSNGTAIAKAVTLGNLYGSYAEILSGLSDTDQVILSRTVIAGDTVSIE